jgi:hypothetical protein
LDPDPLFRFECWQANLRILEIESIRSVPYVPVSHPFIEARLRPTAHFCLLNIPLGS